MCNLDCFNCIHPDCIRDEQQDNRDNYKRYWEQNHKKELERSRRYKAKNRDKVNQANRDWYQKNKEYRREYMREYWKKKKLAKMN